MTSLERELSERFAKILCDKDRELAAFKKVVDAALKWDNDYEYKPLTKAIEDYREYQLYEMTRKR